ncbi:WG repeat-containing protein [Mesorhizobium sp. f-mel]
MTFFDGDQALWPLRSKSNGKIGYIDRNGDWVINPTFDKASRFHGGRAAAISADRWGVLNKRGHWLAAPEGTATLSTYGKVRCERGWIEIGALSTMREIGSLSRVFRL